MYGDCVVPVVTDGVADDLGATRGSQAVDPVSIPGQQHGHLVSSNGLGPRRQRVVHVLHAQPMGQGSGYSQLKRLA